MEKLLLIALLIVGCDLYKKVMGLGQESKEGICVLKDENSNKYQCHPQTEESQCISDSINGGFVLTYWGNNFDCCQDWCNENEVECN